MDSQERAIRRLERWHRMWEINNRDRIARPTFASEHDVTHEHEWGPIEVSPIEGRPYRTCTRCPAMTMKKSLMEEN